MKKIGLLSDTHGHLDPKIFFRVNRTYFVNINKIKDIIVYSNSRLKILLKSYSENDIIVSRERVKDFKEWKVCVLSFANTLV